MKSAGFGNGNVVSHPQLRALYLRLASTEMWTMQNHKKQKNFVLLFCLRYLYEPSKL